jgi:DNA anti-recombination protein RmuC
MSTLPKHLFAALVSTTLLASCSRPVAYFQPSAREHFTSAQPVAVAVTTPAEATPATEPAQSAGIAAAMPEQAAPTNQQLAQTKQAVDQIEAYVRNDSKLASNKKLAKRMSRLNEMLTTTRTEATVTTNAASAKKMSLMERMVLKKMDKKIKNHVAPDETKAMNSNVRLGLIIGLIGLILWLLGGGSVLALIGLIGFIVGLVLILLGVING